MMEGSQKSKMTLIDVPIIVTDVIRP